MPIYITVFITLLFHINIASASNTLPEYNGSPEEIGLAIMREAKLRDQGWDNSTAEMTMTLRTKAGAESIRHMVSKSLEVIGDGDKGLTVFNQPRDIQGTAFLSFSHINTADEQWLYLPALKRVKRIASRNKAGPFMGSEFAYEDLSSFEVEKFSYRYLADENFNSQDCFKIETIPLDKLSGYTKQIIWIGKAHYRVHKIDFYDRRKELRKTLLLSEYDQYLNKFWRPSKQIMSNHVTGKSTDIQMSNFKFNVGLSLKDFNQNALKRAR